MKLAITCNLEEKWTLTLWQDKSTAVTSILVWSKRTAVNRWVLT